MRLTRAALLCSLAMLTLALCWAASAEAQAPRWQLDASTAPTVLQNGGEGQLALTATNIGDAPVDFSGEPLTIRLALPPGLAATKVLGFPLTYLGYLTHFGELACNIASPSLVTCASSAGAILPPFESLEVRVAVTADEGAKSGEEVEASISGGATQNALAKLPLSFGVSTPFGIRRYELHAENEDGSLQTHAGSHPFQFTSTLDFNQTLEANKHFEGVGKLPTTPELLRDLEVSLPPGLVGNSTLFAQCTDLEFETLGSANINLCPAESAVGVASVSLKEPNNQGFATIPVPIFNLTPAAGEPARFGFEALGVPVILDTAIRSGRDYGVVVKLQNISEAATVVSSRVTFWGVPGDQRHDASRGWSCLDWFAGGTCTSSAPLQPPAFLTLPTACQGPPTSTATIDSWGGNSLPPVSFTFQSLAGDPASIDGCGEIPFTPSFSVEPEAHSASTPTGLRVGVHVPQDTTRASTGFAESAVRSTTVTLPEGMQLSPAAADGLLACSIPEAGFEGVDATQTNLFSAGAVACPDASKLGSVTIDTPLLAKPLHGFVYLAAQNANPFSSLVALYLVAEEPVAGVRVKLAGKGVLDQATGQLTTIFENTPELPFEDLTLQMFGGPRAALTTPRLCGSHTATASFTPWSGGAPVSTSSSFAIDSGARGGACSNPPPFVPAVSAGSANGQAGAFAPFSLTMSREDGNQNLSAITERMPPGVLGKLASVTPCTEPQAAQGTCGADSLIGHTVASVGLGSDPFTVSGGQVFITGPYKGAPYGLSIAQPAKAGPYDLGGGACDCIVVRARIEVDPHTATLTVVSDPLPTILQGIPLQVKQVNVTIDRPGFAFNPTNCSRLALNAVLTGEQGATAALSVPYEAANCAGLPFKPKFAFSTQARTSKQSGASLRTRVISGPGQANIGRVRVALPKQLPSRLTTLQKACPAAAFDANPASCPAASVVGTGIAMTPVLKDRLSGPAYLVSHGGEAFPDLEIVLQGENITLVLDGRTDIKKGITSSTFEAVPDAPISSFELSLPEGPHSVLAANLPIKARHSMCGQKLMLPIAITGQNGATIKQTLKASVSGCAKTKKARGKRHNRKRRAAKRESGPNGKAR
ncbi:MAG TPA: hypothetical protein VLJ80_06110 [Solirubrobacteraceae bacterium]|nr:hypothetical protein [Solirubrobacteraceae bacterium]